MSWQTVEDCPRCVYCDVIDRRVYSDDAGRMSASPAFQHALGAAVKARRQELGLTQEELSLRSELHQRWVSNVETGKRNPSYASLRRLAAGLELSASGLLARAEHLEATESVASNAGT
jgi:ribosome-binding protein aMBF1 (putative translation factor)